VQGDVTAQAEQAFSNLDAVLRAAGLTLQDVIKVNVYLTTMDDLAAMTRFIDRSSRRRILHAPPSRSPDYLWGRASKSSWSQRRRRRSRLGPFHDVAASEPARVCTLLLITTWMWRCGSPARLSK